MSIDPDCGCEKLSCIFNKACLISRASAQPRPCGRTFEAKLKMLVINGTAMQRLRAHRAASGYPLILGSWSRPVAESYRDFETELDR